MTVVSMSYLLEAGVHFGHQKRRWNPKMKEYIYTSRDDIYIIDLQKTEKLIEESYEEIKKIAQQGGTFLFIGTKKQANEAMKESAERTGMYYVIERWLGGTLTNFKTIRSRIKRLEEIETMEKDGTFELLPKKEVAKLKKEYEKLNKNLGGIREMKKLPSAILIVDPRQEETAIMEARKLKIPVFGIVDTNCDPDMVDFVIPANDDAVRGVKLVIGVLANAIAEVTGKEVINYIAPDDAKKVAKEKENIMEKVIAETKDIKKEFAEDIKEFKEEVKEKAVKAKKELNEVVEDAKEKHEEVKEEVKKTETKVKKEVEETTKEVKEKATKVAKVVKKAAKEIKEINLEDKTLTELKAMAKDKEIKGYSTMKKAELIEALK